MESDIQNIANYYVNVLKTGFDIHTKCLEAIDEVTRYLLSIKQNHGRVFVLGVGGSAANAAHMVNDLRKLCDIEAYAPTDNISELTARTNDEGFEHFFKAYLKTSKFGEGDGIFILSVGGGSKERNLSVNLINAIDYAKDTGGLILGIVGKEGYTYENAHSGILIPASDPALVTPISEAFQAVIWHGIVSDPRLQENATTW